MSAFIAVHVFISYNQFLYKGYIKLGTVTLKISWCYKFWTIIFLNPKSLARPFISERRRFYSESNFIVPLRCFTC